MFLAKPKLNSIEVVISKALTDYKISHYEFVLINNVLKRIPRYERRNKKFRDLNSSLKILIYS